MLYMGVHNNFYTSKKCETGIFIPTATATAITIDFMQTHTKNTLTNKNGTRKIHAFPHRINVKSIGIMKQKVIYESLEFLD